MPWIRPRRRYPAVMQNVALQYKSGKNLKRQYLYIPSGEGWDLRWKDSTIATDTIVMYTLSLSHARKAIGSMSDSFCFISLAWKTHSSRSQRGPVRPR